MANDKAAFEKALNSAKTYISSLEELNARYEIIATLAQRLLKDRNNTELWIMLERALK